MANRIQLNNSIINCYPQPLAQMYQRFYSACDIGTLSEGIGTFHAFSEKLLKYIVTYLLLERTALSDSNDREARVQLRNLLLVRPTFGSLSRYIKEFRNLSESAELWKCYKRSRPSDWIACLDEFNRQFKSQTHNSLLSESSAEDMLLQYVIPALTGIERLEIFKEFQLCVDRDSGVPKELNGITRIETQSGIDCSSVFLWRNGRKYMRVWPFILLEPQDSKYSVLNLSSIRQDYDNVRPPGITSNSFAGNHTLEYFGTESEQNRFISTGSDNADDRTVESAVKAVLIDYRLGPAHLRLQELDGLSYKISDFSGRTWLNEDIGTFIHNSNQHLFLVKGSPGTGKTAFMLRLRSLLSENQVETFRECLSAHFFYLAGSTVDCKAKQCLQQLENEISQKTGLRHSIQRDQIPDDLLEAGLAKLRSLIQRIPKVDEDYQYTPVLLCIDAIDEIDPSDMEHFLKMVNALRSATNLKILLTSRNIPELNLLEHVDVTVNLDDDQRHHQDIHFYLQTRNAALDEDQSRFLLRQVDGNFLYLSFVIADLKSGLMTPDELGLLPSGLDGYYRNILKVRLPAKFKHNRLDWEDTGFMVLKIICVSAQAPNRTQCARFLGVEVSKVRLALELMSEILVEEHDGSGYAMFHLSFQEYLETEFADELLSAHKLISDSYMKAFKGRKWNHLDSYFYRYFSHHEICSGEWESILTLANEPEFSRRTVEWIKEGDEDTPTDFPDSQGFRYIESQMRAQSGLIEFNKLYLECVFRLSDHGPYQLLLSTAKYFPVLRCMSELSQLLAATDSDCLGEIGPGVFSAMVLLWRKDRLLAEMTPFLLKDKWLSTLYRIVLLDLGCKQVAVSDDDLSSLDYFLFRSSHTSNEYVPFAPNVEATIFKYLRKLGDDSKERLQGISPQLKEVLCLEDTLPASVVEVPEFEIEEMSNFVHHKIERLNREAAEDLSLMQLLELCDVTRGDEVSNRSAYTLALIRKFGQILGNANLKPLVAAIFSVESPLVRTVLFEDFADQFNVSDITKAQIETAFHQYTQTINKADEGFQVFELLTPFSGSGRTLRYLFLERTAEFLWKSHKEEFLKYLTDAFSIAIDESYFSYEDSESKQRTTPPFRILDSDFFYQHFIKIQDDSLNAIVDLMCKAWCNCSFEKRFRRISSEMERDNYGNQNESVDMSPFEFECTPKWSFFLDRLVRPEFDFSDELIEIVAEENFAFLCALQEVGGNYVLTSAHRDELWQCVKFGHSTKEVVNNFLEILRNHSRSTIS